MSRYRLLAIDVDGTLVNVRDEMTEATRGAIARAREAGIEVVLATGRRYGRTLHLVERLGIDVPLIAASGALVKDPRDHHTLYRAQFAPSLLLEMLALVAHNGYEPVLCGDTFAEGFEFYVARRDVKGLHLAEYLRLNPDDGRLWPEILRSPPPDVFTGFIMGTRDEMLDMESRLHRSFPGRLATHVLRSPRYTGFMCELCPAGVSKWSGILRLAQGWGIKAAEICAVGDDVNDLPMIRRAGLGVAMGNAMAEVKSAADRIAPSQEEDGLVTVVDWLLEIADNPCEW
jgi:Cof subfamily protein (haloacid dehalogenase superfamily)